MDDDYESSSAVDLQSFMREQKLNKDLTLDKSKPKYVGSAMSRPHQADDLDYAINPRGKEASEKQLLQIEQARLEEQAAKGNPGAIARLSGPACSICGRYSPFENFSNVSLNSIVEGLIKEIMSGENSIGVKPMPHITNNTSLIYHIAYHHEDKVKEAARVHQKVFDCRRRLQYLEEMNRRRNAAVFDFHNRDQATELWLDIKEKAKFLREQYKDDEEVKQILQRSSNSEGDQTILKILSPDYMIREEEPN